MTRKAPEIGCVTGGIVAVMPLCMAAMIFLLASCTTVGTLPDTNEPIHPSSFHIDKFDWQGAIDESLRLELRNPWGDIRVRTSRRGGMRVTATIQDFADDAFTVNIHPDKTPAHDEGMAPDATHVIVSAGAKQPQGRVDMTVLVPPDMTLLVVTNDGLAEIKYHGAVNVRTESGKIFVKTPGHVEANSATGDIDIAISATAIDRPASVRTNGNIHAWLMPAANINVVAEGRGGVKIGVPYRQKPEGKEIILGDGGETILLSAGHGSVNVRPLPPG